MSLKSAVWVYWRSGELDEELRFSMRSAFANLKGVKNFVICGDKPRWYKGPFIHSRRFTKEKALDEFGTKKWVKVVDSVIKLQAIIDSPLVTDDFLWMYDDTFVLAPITIDQLAVPRSKGKLAHQGNSKWHEATRRTESALKRSGLPTHNYSTHYPVVYNKQKLQETIDLFEARIRPRTIESLYLNHHFTAPKKTAPIFSYYRIPPAVFRPNKPVVNVGVFNAAAQRAIKPRFVFPAPFEHREAWSIEREILCGRCEFNQDNVCIPFKQLQPDRPCRVEHAIHAPNARCPKRYFLAVETVCPKCRSLLSNAEGVSECPCGWQGDQSVPMPIPDDWTILTNLSPTFTTFTEQLGDFGVRAFALSAEEAEAKLPSEVKFVMLVDSNVQFLNSSWVNAARKVLINVDSVYLFNRVLSKSLPRAIGIKREFLLNPPKPRTAISQTVRLIRA